MKILLLSSNPNNHVLVVGSQHWSEILADRHSVTIVSAPHLPFSTARRNLKKTWPREGSLGIAQSMLPWIGPFRMVRRWWGARRIYGWVAAHIAGDVRRIFDSFYDFVLLDDLVFESVLNEISFRYLIYRPTDVYSAMLGSDAYTQIERLVLKRSVLCLCTSQVVLEHVTELGYPVERTRLVENGVEWERFACATTGQSALASIQGKRALYVGVIDARFDVELLSKTATMLPNWSFLVAGPVRRAIRDLPSNVHLMGPVDYGDVPALMKDADVGIMPLSAHPANEGRSPMKLFEYLAAGVPVVSTSTAELRRRGLAGVSLVTSAAEFAAEISNPNPPRPDVLREQARKYSWRSIVARVEQEMLSLINDV